MTTRAQLTERIRRLAVALDVLIDEVTVVGGTSPVLYPLNATVAVRPTTDVDLIIRSSSGAQWHRFVRALETRGFKYPAGEPVCRYRKGELIIDVMPTDADQLGFGNRWYDEAAKHRIATAVAGLHVIAPVYFVATKLDAYASRGSAQPMSSHDLEDIFVVLRGLPALLDEIRAGSDAVHVEVRRQLGEVVRRQDALDLVRALIEGDEATQAIAPSLLSRIRDACRGAA